MFGDAFHYMRIRGDRETCVVHHSTNDDEDRGYPNKYEEWEEHFDGIVKALKNTGYSRFGVSGVEVGVFCNGVRVTKSNYDNLIEQYS